MRFDPTVQDSMRISNLGEAHAHLDEFRASPSCLVGVLLAAFEGETPLNMAIEIDRNEFRSGEPPKSRNRLIVDLPIKNSDLPFFFFVCLPEGFGNLNG